MVRQLMAIMFTDMVGYTALMQENERQALINRDRQRMVLAAAVARHDGKILQLFGDGTLSVFQSAIQAVECAIEIQAALAEHPRVPLRIGVHTGDVVRDEAGVFGDGVNVCSRIQTLSVPGGILISDKVYDEVKNQPDIKTKSMGLFQLKNVRRQMHVYAVIGDHLAVPSEPDLMAARIVDAYSIAVLPFVNMSADPENEFFSDGISEEIINALTRLNGLQVTARTSSFAFKGTKEDIRQVAATLGVTTILEGSVRRSGNRVRIGAQLVRAKDGYHIFSEIYDRSLDDAFATQDEIARTIVGELRARVPGAGQPPTGDGPPPAEPLPLRGPPTGAYNEYLRGRFHFNRWSPQGARRSIVHYERAAAMDPAYAMPFSGMATAYAFLGVVGTLPPAEAFPKAERAAVKALVLQDSGESHLALGAVKLFWHWDFPGAYHAFQRALGLNPGSADAHHLYGLYLRAVGETEAMLEEIETALELDPLSLAINHSLGEAYFAARKDDEAREQLRRTLELDPAFRAALETLGWLEARAGSFDVALRCFERMAAASPSRYSGAAGLGFVLARLGRRKESREILTLLESRHHEEPGVVTAWDAALIHLGLGEPDAAIENIERAVGARLGHSVFLRTDRIWDELRPDRRFQELLARVQPQPVRVEALV
jgi:adenylate cyclase